MRSMGDIPAGQETEEIPSDMIYKSALRILAATAIGDPDPLTRRHALYLLGMAGDPACIGVCGQALRDPEKAVRDQATRNLSGFGEQASGLLINLLGDPDWKVRYRAAEALGAMKDGKAGKTLTSVLRDEKDHVRYMAAKALGQIQYHQAIPGLEVCLHDENRYVRKMAAEALFQIIHSSPSDS